jgi:hypothetical protein
VLEKYKIKGLSQMEWTADLAVFEPKTGYDAYAVVYCLDLSKLSFSPSIIKDTLNLIALALYDSSWYEVRYLVVRTTGGHNLSKRRRKHEGQNNT